MTLVTEMKCIRVFWHAEFNCELENKIQTFIEPEIEVQSYNHFELTYNSLPACS